MRFPGLKFNRFSAAFALLLMAAVFGGLPATAQADAPYVYYYSRLLNAFVIERADGTDSRMFGAGLTPPEHDIIQAKGWSPSGEWFAWLSAAESGVSDTITSHQVWLVNMDGERMPIFDGMAGFSDAYWSPEADVLFLVDRNYTNTTVYQFDIATKQITMQLEGEFEPRPKPVADGSTYTDESAISPDGRYNISLNSGVLTDTQTGADVPLRFFSGYDGWVCSVNWHPDGEWLLRRDNMVYAGGGCGSGFVVANISGTIQRELGACGKDAYCADWLPDHVMTQLAAGQVHSVVPEPFLTLQSGDRLLMAADWRADGAAIAVYAESSQATGWNKYVLIWSKNDAGEWRLTGEFEIDHCYLYMFNGCEVEWSPDGAQIAVTNDFTTQIVDAASGEIVFVGEESFAGWRSDNTPILTGRSGDADYAPETGYVVRVTDAESGNLNALEIFSEETGVVVGNYTTGGSNTSISATAFLSKETTVVMLEGDRLLVWNWNPSVNQRRVLPVNSTDYITDLTAVGPYILGYGRATLVYIWDADTGRELGRLNHYGYGVALARDGSTLATVGGQALNLWHLETSLSP